MAGAEGFEPPNASTKNWCLTTWRRPISNLTDFTVYGRDSQVHVTGDD